MLNSGPTHDQTQNLSFLPVRPNFGKWRQWENHNCLWSGLIVVLDECFVVWDVIFIKQKNLRDILNKKIQVYTLENNFSEIMSLGESGRS